LGSFGTSAEPATSHPSHDTWVAKDQQVLGFINASLSREILSHVATCTSAAAVWRELQVMFTSQSRACTIQLHTRLVTTHKCVLSAAVYYNKMKGFADGTVAAGKPLEDDDFISYVLVRLDHDYNSSDQQDRYFPRNSLLTVFGCRSKIGSSKLSVPILCQCCYA
jgi:hypothetical protein